MDKFPGDAAKVIDQSESFLLGEGGGGGGEKVFPPDINPPWINWQSIWQAVGNHSTHSMHIQDARKTFVSKTPPKFDFSIVNNSVMLTDYI